MADMSKAEKLAAARKKLREFQHNKEGGTTNSTSRSTPERGGSRTETPIAEPFKTVDGGAYINFQQSISIDNNNSHSDKLEHNESPENGFSNRINLLSPMLPPQNVGISNNFATSTPNIDAGAPPLSDTIITEEMVTSTSETIRQLAMQMNGLIGHELDCTGSPTLTADNLLNVSNTADKHELLVRNQQLAAQLAEREQVSDHLQASFTQLQTIASKREEELKRLLAEVEQKWTGECAALREQLQLHSQTVGILVAEKTEAQSALSRAQASAKAKAAEAEEAQGRLRASRHKLSELESSLAAIKSGQEQQNEQLNATTSELERLKEQLRAAVIQRNESKDETSQLQQRLHASNQHVATLQAELQERHSQLSIAQVRLQQLGGSVPGGVEVSEAQAELQAEHERRVALEQEVSELRSATAEKEQTSQQYQQFIEQLNTQLTSLASKLQESTKENENLNDRQQNLIKHIGELESRLQHTPVPKASPTAEEIAEKNKMQQKLEALQDSKQLLQVKLEAQESETAKLKLQLVQAEERVVELQEGRPDEARLLAVMESDKVAAARATAQNTQLKQQLLEQQHVHAQLIDQLRHHEARLQNAEKLQQDLLQAQEQIKILSNENERLKAGPATASEAEESNKVPSVGSLTPEAAERLQDRFAQTMRQLAETSDEKQRLEHLVMQLQGETETIGEYVALYQQQRGLLQQRAAEKDKEMERMAADREQLKQKLQRVGQLVSDLVVRVPGAENKDAAATDLLQSKPAGNAVAEQISALLSEICDSESLAAPVASKECVQHNEKHSTDTMLPCPLCSGRLEVV